MTDPFGYDVQISGLANNALTDVWFRPCASRPCWRCCSSSPQRHRPRPPRRSSDSASW